MARCLLDLAVGLFIVCSLVACGTTTQNANQTGSATPNTAGVGDTLTINPTSGTAGNLTKTTVDVTLLKTADPGKAFPGSDTPQGKRWITVQIERVNTGHQAFDDGGYYRVGEGGVALTDTQGNTIDPIGFDLKGLLKPGDADHVSASFLIPNDVKPATLRYWTAEWAIDH
jgi:hypothetical protein